jgi:hypothetical protein
VQESSVISVYKNADDLSVSAGARGEVVSVGGVSLNEGGKIDYSVRTETAIPDNSSELTIGGSPLRSHKIKIYKNGALGDLSESTETGKIKNVSVQLNSVGLLDYAVETITAETPGDTPSFTSESSGDKTVTTEIYRNAVAIPSISGGSGATSYRLSASLNEFGRYDCVKDTIVISTPAGGSYDLTGDQYPAFSVSSLTGKVGTIVIEEPIYTHTISYHTTEASAFAAIHGGYTGSGVSKYSDGIWRAVHINRRT